MSDGPGWGDLTACEAEPIHTPASIQPHGFLLSLAEPDHDILWVSANLRSMLRYSRSRPLRSLTEVFGNAAMIRLDSVLRDRSRGSFSTFRIYTETGVGMDLIWHHQDGCVVVEGEPAFPEDPPSNALFDRVTGAIDRMRRAANLQDLVDLIAREARNIINYDRVMVYRFDPEWNGEVIAESRRGSSFASFLGQHFPASDIPAQARALYTLNPLRSIPDVGYEPVPLLKLRDDGDDRPLDLSHAVLRSVSPIHIEYLVNMGVRASLSLSLIHGGQLWGLIACHHSVPRVVPHAVRAVAVLFSEVASFKLGELLSRERAARIVANNEGLDLFGAAMLAQGSPIAAFRAEEGWLQRIFESDGIVVQLEGEGEHHRAGSIPPDSWIGRLIARLAAESGGEVFATDHLASLDPDFAAFAHEASGALFVPLSVPGSCILVLRREVPRSISWAGNPRQKQVAAEGPPRIHPRKSFEAWSEVVRGRSAPWSEDAVAAARLLRRVVLQGASRFGGG